MPDSTAKQDRADRKLAKYISKRNLAIGIIVLTLVIITAIFYGLYAIGSAGVSPILFRHCELIQRCRAILVASEGESIQARAGARLVRIPSGPEQSLKL